MSDEKRKMFECMELLSDELCQTQAFILRALSRAGLALVPAADVLKPEERAVLEAVAAIPGSELRSRGNWYGYAKKVGDAEAARRAAKEAKGG